MIGWQDTASIARACSSPGAGSLPPPSWSAAMPEPICLAEPETRPAVSASPAVALPVIGLSALQRFTAGDAERIRLHLLSLNADDRTLRFGYGIADPGIAAYVARLDYEQDYVAGLSRADGSIAALAHAGIRDGEADFGLSVIHELRGHGLGQVLFEHVIALAWQAGAERVLCHSISPAVIHMASRHGFRRPGGSHDAVLTLERPTHLPAPLPERRPAS